ncbi:hypothetical protein B0H17DRAFT_229302 [Mycena rosella]|uniref:Uncharacterized protein n=1 Tax=Mycena rosella TaxID=1033263 RepID=A0AAD7H175_MYCRO|nr:hypothetical protein B0H17DRAFT_229302 [Mycena rosella]
MSESPPRKRPRSETLTNDSDDSLASLGRYTAEHVETYLTSLRAVSADLSTFADPSNFSSLPFPSLLRSSIPSLHPPTGQYNFNHMGRPVFSTIVSQVQRLDRQIPSPVALLGTYAAGKSHLLAALASFLFAQGKRVVFIPESTLLNDDPVFWLRLAFALPFADLPGTTQRIMQFKTTDEFIEFARGRREDLYFLVDGPDRLERQSKDLVLALTSSHFYIYTSYALDPRMPIRDGFASIRIPSGLTGSEGGEWRRHFESQLPLLTDQYFSFLEDLTGLAPGLLTPLSEFRGQDWGEISLKYRAMWIFNVIADEVAEFTTTVETFSPAQKSRYLKLMSACLTETIPEIRPGSNTALYDPRYFYFDSDNRGHCACGLARDTMIPVLRLEDLDLFTSDAWYSGVRTGCRSIRDTAILQICLTRIGAGGLTQADAAGNTMRICAFRQDPIFGWMFEEAWKSPRGMTSFLCIPGAEVCKFLSAVILRINPGDKTCHLIPLQITTSQVCTELASLFFGVVWHRWEQSIQHEGFKVVNTYVCVDSRTPESADVITQSTAFRDKVRFVSPQYTARNLSVAVLDPKLGRILEGDKYQSPPA